MCYGSVDSPTKIVDFKGNRTMDELVAFMNSQ